MFQQKSFSRIVILHLIAVLFVIFNISDIRIAGLAKLIPLFDLMMIFYFTIFTNIFAIWFIFILGIWNDGLNGNPLGLTALCYILLIKFFLLLNSKMWIRENFRQIWQQFTAFAFLFLLLKWLLLSIFDAQFYSFNFALLQLILSSLFYVPMHRFFDYLKSKLIDE